jgi:hypothetical protein
VRDRQSSLRGVICADDIAVGYRFRFEGRHARYSPRLAWPHMKRIAGLYIAGLIAAAMPVFTPAASDSPDGIGLRLRIGLPAKRLVLIRIGSPATEGTPIRRELRVCASYGHIFLLHMLLIKNRGRLCVRCCLSSLLFDQ